MTELPNSYLEDKKPVEEKVEETPTERIRAAKLTASTNKYIQVELNAHNLEFKIEGEDTIYIMPRAKARDLVMRLVTNG